MDILVFFSKNGKPAEGLTTVITIKNDKGETLKDKVAMDEISDGFYRYNFRVRDTHNYVTITDGGDDELDNRYLYRGGKLIEQVTILDANEIKHNSLGANRTTQAILESFQGEMKGKIEGLYSAVEDIKNNSNKNNKIDLKSIKDELKKEVEIAHTKYKDEINRYFNSIANENKKREEEIKQKELIKETIDNMFVNSILDGVFPKDLELSKLFN